MFKRKNIRLILSSISFFILPGCSKSDQTAYTLNTITYTFTDTTGINYTFSDTTFYVLKYSGYYGHVGDPGSHIVDPGAFIMTGPDTTQLQEFHFGGTLKPGGYNDTTSYLNFSLPFFQASLSGPGNFSFGPLVFEWKDLYRDVHYVAASPSSNLGANTVYLASFTTSSNISDSADGLITGNFNISATTVDSGKIHIGGKFSRAPSNYRP